MKHTVRDELGGVITFVVVIWAVYLLDSILPGQFTDWGVVPRTIWGIAGIPLMPVLHANLPHLMSNTVPLLVLLTLLAGSHTRTWETVVEIVLVGGGLLWLLGRPGGDTGNIVHVGASGLIYGLIAFLIVAGFREKRLVPLGVAVVVGFLYGTTLIMGILPTVGPGVSWEGHFYGAIAGAAVAYFSTGYTGEESVVEE